MTVKDSLQQRFGDAPDVPEAARTLTDMAAGRRFAFTDWAFLCTMESEDLLEKAGSSHPLANLSLLQSSGPGSGMCTCPTTRSM